MRNKFRTMTPSGTTWVALLCLLCGLLPQLSAAESWPIKTFKVVNKHPDNLTTWFEEPVSEDLVREIEGWLNQLANIYEQMGFRKPNYTDIESGTLDEAPAFRVYLYAFTDPNKAPAGMGTRCGTSPGVPLRMILNSASEKIIKNNQLTNKGYQDIAHELFHAVQQSYPLFSCNIGGWISEGTADMVGIEMARRYVGKKAYSPCQIGFRPYSRALYTDGEHVQAPSPCHELSLDYQAQSFWQFLGEYATRKKYIATAEFTTPDLKYLHAFFETPHDMGSRQKEYAWLDKALQSAKRNARSAWFGNGLHRIYSRFSGTFASYWQYDRTKLYYKEDPETQEDVWMRHIFGKCESRDISKDNDVEVTLNFHPVAARCVKLNFTETARVNVVFHAPEDEIRSLAVSMDGGKKIIRHDPGEQLPDRLGHFAIDAKPGKPVYLVVSNVARDAAETLHLKTKLTLKPEFIDTSKARAKKDPGDDSGSTPKKELENAWASRSWKGAARQRERSPCTRPFEASPCGPTTYLNLQMVTDTAQLLDEVSQPALVRSERMIEVLGAIEERGAAQLPMDLIKGINEIRSLDGWEVRITLPQIQPGFTGSIDNAHIRVAKAVNPDGSANGDWRAIGPEWQGSCRDGFHPASGMVTFSSFTEKSARGSFSAKLIDVEYSPGCQAAPVDTTINGDFIITSVDLGDSMPVPQVSDEDILEDVIEDTNELLPGFISEDMREYLKEQVNNNEPGEAEQSQEQGTGRDTRAYASDLDRCGCSCELESQLCRANPGAECCQLCEPLFKMCRQAVTGHQSITQQPTHADDEHIALRQRYEAYVDSIAPNATAKQQLMAAFDALKTIDEKKLFMMAIPHAH